MDFRFLTEQETRTQFITPAIVQAGWCVQTQVREEYALTDGTITVRGNMSSRLKRTCADYVLFIKPNIPLAVVEAKKYSKPLGEGMAQALRDASRLDVPFSFSSNGQGFLFHDKTAEDGAIEKEITLDAFPSPSVLWEKYCRWKGLDEKASHLIQQSYYSDGSDKTPRPYQLQAINRTMEAVVNGQKRILLVMATGTGKTYTAMQIIWRLKQAGLKKRILFLADRNILVDQTKINDFKPFEKFMTKIQKRHVDKSYEVYLALYQGMTGNEEDKNTFKQFDHDFFDLIIVDECHRGSAKNDSAWREILEYYSSATQIGLTATPKETKDVSNIDYFGEPLFVYSLKQGIEDGFLAPYKVTKVTLDVDLEGWRPTSGQVDKYGNPIEDREYNQRDYDRNLVLEKRTRCVAERVVEHLESSGDPYAKTIVFCEDIDHAERMRQAIINANPERAKEDSRYVMRITGDNDVGKAELDNFIDPNESYPVIATTSQLMTTGVDAKTCKLIVLDKIIQSPTEFKQIIGRGTRVSEAHGKTWFTIMDFKKATERFLDPEFDGEPISIYDPAPDAPIIDNTGEPEPPTTGEPPDPPLPPGGKKYVVADGVVTIFKEQIQYLDNQGKLITENVRDYYRKKVEAVYSTMTDFLKRWEATDQHEAILKELQEQGLDIHVLEDVVGKGFSAFDLICHIAYGQPPLTRKERIDNVKKRDYFTKYGEKARAVLEALLEKYADAPPDNLADIKLLQVNPFSELGTPMELIQAFGSKANYEKAVYELEAALYKDSV